MAQVRRSTLIDDLVLEYASPRTQRLLREYDAQTQVCVFMDCRAAVVWPSSRPRMLAD